MNIDVLVAEIGSTTTIVNAFNITDTPYFIGRGMAQTTVDTDVVEGLEKAINNLSKSLDTTQIKYKEMFATSSAAGGLKVAVSGLVYEMTVKAAKEAALNAGANIHLINAGILTDYDIEQIKEVQPNMIIVAGGTDYGEKQTAYENIRKLEAAELFVPIIYAGNIDNVHRIKSYFKTSSQQEYLRVVENVYPTIDYMNISPLRQAIYMTFEEHIINAKGMSRIKEMVNSSIMPTPGSVMEATMLIYDKVGGVITIDVGGATSDVHSVVSPSEKYSDYYDGVPLEKRTVEGDLGVYVNLRNALNYLDVNRFREKHKLGLDTYIEIIDNFPYIARSIVEKDLLYEATSICVYNALDRHIGDYRKVFTSSGRKLIPEGRDCSQVKSIILTGGALLSLEKPEDIINSYLKKKHTKMIPENRVDLFLDHHYIMASIGVLSLKYPEVALELLKQSLKIKDD